MEDTSVDLPQTEVILSESSGGKSETSKVCVRWDPSTWHSSWRFISDPKETKSIVCSFPANLSSSAFSYILGFSPRDAAIFTRPALTFSDTKDIFSTGIPRGFQANRLCLLLYQKIFEWSRLCLFIVCPFTILIIFIFHPSRHECRIEC